MAVVTESLVNERVFTFEKNEDKLTVRIPEVLSPQYGLYTWPSAVVLAQYLWYNRNLLPGKKVLELSAGTALPGIVSAFCGADVTLSDTASEPRCLKNCQKSSELNNLKNVRILGIDWGTITANVQEITNLDLLLASDCFYDPHDFEDILFTVTYILRSNPGCQFLCTYQNRSSEWTIEDLLHKWDLKYQNIHLDTFQADTSNIANSNLPGQSVIEMMKIKL